MSQQPSQPALVSTSEASSSGTAQPQQISLFGENASTPIGTQKTSPKTSFFTTFADVLLPLENKELGNRTFTYGIPESQGNLVQPGIMVLVPFGQQPQLTGIVVKVHHQHPLDSNGNPVRVRAIADLLDDCPLFDVHYFAFIQWIAQTTATPLSQVIQCALPANVFQKVKRVVSLTEKAKKATVAPRGQGKSSAPQTVLAHLQHAKQDAVSIGRIHLKTNLSRGVVLSALQTLQSEGWVTLETQLGDKPPKPKSQWVVAPAEPIPEESPKTQKQQQALDAIVSWFLLHPDGQLPLSQCPELTGMTTSVIEKLVTGGWLTKTEATIHRHGADVYADGRSVDQPVELTPEQTKAVETVSNGKGGEYFLLYGITGSGKTEVYMELAVQALDAGRSVLFLVPEIALSHHLAHRLAQRFGSGNLALWHSQLSDGEKIDTWRRIQSGDLRLVIGARSAIFTPLKNLGLIVLDEAHEDAYKQDAPPPRYDARILAEELARRHGAHVVGGSATPDIARFQRVLEGDGQLIRLPQRFGGRQLAKVQTIDMRQEIQQGHSGPISRGLLDALKENLSKQEQSIVLINRRGFHPLISCGECGHTIQCPHCAVCLTLHRHSQKLHCHYCGYTKDPLPYCTECASTKMVRLGAGSQRIEAILQEELPEARICRIDSDTMSRKHALRETMTTFSQGNADILVGTQMVAKGLDIPNVTLVGVIGADQGFKLPDYKSAERCFQLLTQVAGRAGRGEKPGRVLVQTLSPDHPVIQLAKHQDFQGFFAYEQSIRQEMGFPPHQRLFRFIASSPNESELHHWMDSLRLHLEGKLQQASLTDSSVILGPTPCLIEKIQNRYRYHLVVKGEAQGLTSQPQGQLSPLHQAITQFYTQMTPPESIRFFLDIDPLTLL